MVYSLTDVTKSEKDGERLSNLQADARTNARSAMWAAIGNFVLAAVKIFAGVTGHSRALVADGIHSAADLVSSIAVIVGLRIAQRPPDEGHNYGHAKAEAVSQKIVAVLLMFAGFQVGTNAFHAWFHPSRVKPSLLPLIIAGVATIIKVGMYISQRKVAKRTGSHAVMASALDSRMDIISSGIATAAIVAAVVGVPHADAVGALVVAILIIRLSYEIFSEAANDLMDRAAAPAVVTEIQSRVRKTAGVMGVSSLRTRVSGTQVLVDIEIEVSRALSLVEAHRIAHQVKDAVMQIPRIQDITVHVNPETTNSSSKGGVARDE